jgi:hypothetical protein
MGEKLSVAHLNILAQRARLEAARAKSSWVLGDQTAAERFQKATDVKEVLEDMIDNTLVKRRLLEDQQG